MNTNYKKLADGLVKNSIRVDIGEHVLIHSIDIPELMVKYLVDAVVEAGGYPHIKIDSGMVNRSLISNADQHQLDVRKKAELYQMKQMDCYLCIRGGKNSYNLSDIDSEKNKLYRKVLRPVVDHRVKKTKWCICVWPTDGLAQSANMSTEAFEEFFFKACTFDHSTLDKGASALVDLMNKTDKVKIVGPGTDLSFSIKDIPAIKCIGEYNIPDGEVFSAPVKKSVNGNIKFNAVTTYAGKTFNGIKLEFIDGKVVNCDCDSGDKEELEKILDSDKGARYIGEFAIAFNPIITKPMNDILFDEKIYGSFHFTPGACYDEASNGNKSMVHWDMVCLQSKHTGHEGEIWFDDVLIRKDGEFVVGSLKSLNK